MKHVQLLFLRHGHCQGGEILRGRTDVDLSELGVQQMHHSFTELNELPSIIFSSPLKRCALFSDLIAKQHRLPIRILDGLQEIDFGDWDGQSWQSLYDTYADKIDLYWATPWDKALTPQNGEHFIDFDNRVSACVAAIIKQLLLLPAPKAANLNKPDAINKALVVTHGGVIRSVLGHILGDGFSECDAKSPQNQLARGVFKQFNLPYGALIEIDVFIDANDVVTEPLKAQQISCRLNWPMPSFK
ncbi:histidine phosphatase family protein [Shewanella gaetbuli]|uniref:Histidine phosphatase family protein n=1 Tax=Shewanella gaetbuli TaxID=220752 RepID=A0A9X1ZJ88_9GAMM|nr:histidine phosphatase family protein [Shewanella gaetbuli]MCL1141987.1 histidine phosphatase family protein [Shewanella gaetbuli]